MNFLYLSKTKSKSLVKEVDPNSSATLVTLNTDVIKE